MQPYQFFPHKATLPIRDVIIPAVRRALIWPPAYPKLGGASAVGQTVRDMATAETVIESWEQLNSYFLLLE